MNCRRECLCFVLILSIPTLFVSAQEPIVPIIESDVFQKTGIAPAFFGPNAFPVPEMSEGAVSKGMTFELAGDFYKGFIVSGGTDLTYDIFLNFRTPLFSDRVGLNVWMVPREWYTMDQSVMDARRILVDEGKRSESGDVYIALEIALLKERKYLPAMLLRGVLKTASGNSFGMARYYDSAGYFFDLTLAKSFFARNNGFFRDLRIGASIGFLCWQTDNGR